MKVLVTGACGFLGRHLIDYIRSKNKDVVLYATDIIECGSLPVDGFWKADITENDHVRDLIDNTLPNSIIHLAGLFGSSTAESCYKVNLMSLLLLLEEVRKKCFSAVVLAAGSAAEYGNVKPECQPVSEDCPCNPTNIYGHTKYLATQTAMYYYHIYGINVMVFRPFQLIGEGISNKLAPGAFVEKVLHCLKNNEKIIKVGNLQSFRDFLDISDAVSAIWKLCCNPVPGEIFNVCSGRLTQMSDLLHLITKESGANIEVEIDNALLRGNEDVTVVYGNNKKIQLHCGWKPAISLQQSVKNMLKDKQKIFSSLL